LLLVHLLAVYRSRTNCHVAVVSTEIYCGAGYSPGLSLDSDVCVADLTMFWYDRSRCSNKW